jgi:YceI-like domain
MKNLLSFLLVLLFINSATAQDKYFTKTGKINFDATEKNSPESITGVNNSVTSVLDTKTGNFQFAVLVKGFEFERALMMEHFNENYLESDKFPKAEFRGQVVNNVTANYQKNGSYDVVVKGSMSMHGTIKEVETKGKITVLNGDITASADFPIALADFKITIPTLVADKVAKVATVKVNCILKPLK